MFCNNCGATLSDNARFCNKCGATIAAPAATTQPIQQAQPVQTPQPAQPSQPPQPTQPTYSQQPVQQPQTPQPQQPPQPAQPTYSQQPYVAPPAVAPPAAAAPYVAPPAAAAPPRAPRKKMHPGLIAAFIAVPLLIAGGLIFFLTRDKGGDDPKSSPNASAIASESPSAQRESPTESTLPVVSPSPQIAAVLPDVTYTYMQKQPEPHIEFTMIDSLFPSNYRTLESLATFAGYCEYGEMDVLVEVEVPGFTQPYKQKVHLGRQVSQLRIVPPLITGYIDLNSEKMAQIIFSVIEIDTGKILEYETRSLRLYSKYDIIWGDEDNWDAYTDDILAWMTPDAPEIQTLQREAIDYLSYITDGALNMMIGYQDYQFFEHYYYNTWVQAVALQGAMSDITQVRYNMAPFSMDAHQRVKLPADTLNTKSGLCVETSLVMASALQSAGMHVMLLFPPGHCQVAVEAWPGTGDYFLIETTILPMAQNMATWEYVVQYLDKDQWYEYIDGAPCYVVDCDLGAKLGIRVLSN